MTEVDDATISDANFSVGDSVDCSGWKSVLVVVRFDGGTSPTATIQPLHRAPEAPEPDPAPGSGWVVGANTAALAEGVGAIVTVNGRKTFFRVHALTGSPDGARVLVAGWEPFRPDGPSRG